MIGSEDIPNLNAFAIDPQNTINATIENPYIPPPLYYDYGMYYVHSRDISKFNDYDLKRRLCNFYTTLLETEYERKSLQQYFDTTGSHNFTNAHFLSYMQMRSDILADGIMIPDLSKGLENEMQ